MAPLPAPTQFRGKSWIAVVSALVFGNFALFGLIFGPLFLTGAMKAADGRPTTNAGIALSIFGVVFGLVAVLALFRARALRQPLVRLRRQGIVVRVIGATSLDGLPHVPVFGDGLALLRVAWSIVSLQGFKQQLVYTSWQSVRDAQVWGPPLQRKLTIFASFARPSNADGLPEQIFDNVQFEEVAFADSLTEVARAIAIYCADEGARQRLPSWNDDGNVIEWPDFDGT